MIKHAAASEDFTFPRITDYSSVSHLDFPRFSTSSFWFVHSTAISDTKQQCQGVDNVIKHNTHERNSSTTGGRHGNPGLAVYVDGIFRDKEEKMDLLWEDFNDKSGLVSFVGKEGVILNNSSNPMVGFRSDAAPAQAQAQALKMSKRHSSIVHRRKASLWIILKFLKKFFLA